MVATESTPCTVCNVDLGLNPVRIPPSPKPVDHLNSRPSLHRVAEHPLFLFPCCSLCADSASKVESGILLKIEAEQVGGKVGLEMGKGEEEGSEGESQREVKRRADKVWFARIDMQSW